MAEMAGEWMAEHKVKFQRKCVPTKVSGEVVRVNWLLV